VEKVREFCRKHREVLLYLVFGGLTTLVGWVVYFAILWSWRAIHGLASDDTSSKLYLIGYTVAQVVQWVAAVLFAFFTNRKWVFTDADRSVPVGRQLATFSAGRVATFFVDYVVTYFGALGLTMVFPALVNATLFGVTVNLCDVAAKVVAAVIVIVCNYIFSKWLVFKNRKSDG
jgi:putative flippase GtrA